VAGAVALAIGEPYVDRAIAFEEHAAAAAPAHEPETGPVSRDGQRAGLLLATALYGIGVGGLFALVYAGVRGRLGPRHGGALAAWLAGVLFVSVVLVPFLKYPANPPAVGNPETIGERTALYGMMVAISLLSLIAAVRVPRLVPHRPSWAQPAAAAGSFVVLVAVAFVVLPGFAEAPPDFPANLLWDFRLAALGTQVALWATLGGVFAAVTERAERR
jgi:hypothetical protein